MVKHYTDHIDRHAIAKRDDILSGRVAAQCGRQDTDYVGPFLPVHESPFGGHFAVRSINIRVDKQVPGLSSEGRRGIEVRVVHVVWTEASRAIVDRIARPPLGHGGHLCSKADPEVSTIFEGLGCF